MLYLQNKNNQIDIYSKHSKTDKNRGRKMNSQNWLTYSTKTKYGAAAAQQYNK
jgi:hypothetical protein